MATDLAEFVGAAIALNLLFGVPLFAAGLMTAVVAFGILALQSRGYRRFEIVIAGLLGVILLGFLYDTLRIGADAGAASRAASCPGFAGTDSDPARHRHPRRDGHAARDLPALGADAGPHPDPRRRRAPPAAALPAHRRHDRDGHRRRRQHVDADHRRRRCSTAPG